MPDDTTAHGDAADRPGAMTDILRLSFGDVPGGESGMQLFADHLIHGWDLAVGIGGLTELDPDAVAACLSWFAEQEDAHRSAGAVGPRPEPEWPWARAGLAPKETADHAERPGQTVRARSRPITAHQATPAAVYTSRPKATPGDRGNDTHDRVRRDRIDKAGKITLRYQGRLYSIGIGRTHARTRVLILVQDLQIRIIDAATGELLRELLLDPRKRYQGTGRPPGPTR